MTVREKTLTDNIQEKRLLFLYFNLFCHCFWIFFFSFPYFPSVKMSFAMFYYYLFLEIILISKNKCILDKNTGSEARRTEHSCMTVL